VVNTVTTLRAGRASISGRVIVSSCSLVHPTGVRLCVLGPLPPVSKRLGLEADQCLPSRTEFKYTCRVTTTSACAFMVCTNVVLP
jgi:hypothetical protein